jgi:hypothetical protein
MDLDTKIPSKGTLRERIAELEELEATGAATPSTCEAIVGLHEFLDALYTMSLEHARKTLR